MNAAENVEKPGRSGHWWEREMAQSLWKAAWQFLKVLRIVTTQSSSSTPTYVHKRMENWYSSKNLYVNDHSSTGLSQRVEIAQIPIT